MTAAARDLSCFSRSGASSPSSSQLLSLTSAILPPVPASSPSGDLDFSPPTEACPWCCYGDDDSTPAVLFLSSSPSWLAYSFRSLLEPTLRIILSLRFKSCKGERCRLSGPSDGDAAESCSLPHDADLIIEALLMPSSAGPSTETWPGLTLEPSRRLLRRTTFRSK